MELESYRQRLFDPRDQQFTIRGTLLHKKTDDRKELDDLAVISLVVPFHKSTDRAVPDHWGWARFILNHSPEPVNSVGFSNTVQFVEHDFFGYGETAKQLKVLQDWQRRWPEWIDLAPSLIWRLDDQCNRGGHLCGMHSPYCLGLLARIQDAVGKRYKDEEENPEFRAMYLWMYRRLFYYLEYRYKEIELWASNLGTH